MPATEQIAVLYVPCASEEEAEQIARSLLEERLIACANMWQSRSIYRWDGEVRDGPETIMLLKTTGERERAVRSRVRELHSYKVPCILALGDRGVNGDYASWVYGEVAGHSLVGRSEE
jgi:periplasmic divalent cation tolerance protein